MKETRRKRWVNSVFTTLLSFMMVWTMIPGLFLNSTAYAAAGSTPPHTKNLTDNHDGTYTISLDVVGESERKPNPVNVIVILDHSGSMDERTGGYGSQTRMAAAKNAVNNLARSLFAYNTTEFPNLVQMALVGFSTHGAVTRTPTNSYNTFSAGVTGLNANGGTNWEDALQDAKGIDFNDEDPTYVIFVSDGNPTFRNTRGNYNPMDQYYYNSEGVYGNGSDSQTVGGIPAATTIARCYEHATDDAASLATDVDPTHFYTIGAYGNVDRMQSLTTAAGAPASNYFSAANTTDLQNALAAILAEIEKAGIGSVEIEDGTTNKVATSSGVAELLEVDTTSFKYYRDGVEWKSTDDPAPPAATFTDGAVDWDLSSLGVLDDGVKYTVTFDCYPSQYTYDTIAKLKNGDIQYSDLDAEVQKYIEDNGGGNYSLRTNTTATLDWDDTRTDADEESVTYDNPDPVRTDAQTLTAKKLWEGGEPDVDAINMSVLMDGEVFHSDDLTGPDWETSSFISIGIIKDGRVLPGAEGHDFKFAELDDEQYHWELDTPTVHPMLVNGTVTMLVMEDATHQAPSGATKYTINNKTYFADTSVAGLTATNHRRSNLNIRKDVTGEDAPEDATFPFTFKVDNAKAPDTEPADDPEHNSDYWLWFSIYDTKGSATVMDAVVDGAEGPNDDGYYYAPNNSDISVEMKAGWNLRFINLPTGTEYTIEEGELADGFVFDSAKLESGEGEFTPGQTSTGSIDNTKTAYQVVYTNDYALTDLKVTKEWVDNDNQDGIRLTADELKAKLTLSPAVEGKEPTVVDNEDGTYTITYTGLPRYDNGEEVEYAVAESAIDGYTTEGSPAKDHETITNTHEPEVTSVTVVKEWEDSDDIGKIRPASIQAQLKADGQNYGNPVTLNAESDPAWSYTWENLPKYKAGEVGQEIVYTADETAVPAGYEKSGPEKTTAEDGTVTFTVTNTYNPTPVSVDPPVQKVISNNDDLYNGGDFTFTIEAVTDGAPMPENTSITNSPEYELEDREGFYEFGPIQFTMPGTYEYKVTESGSVDGVTNDPDAATGKTLTFTVEDDGTGNLTVSPTTDEVSLAFTNVYDADGEASIVVSKEVAGAAWPSGKSLTLTLEGSGNAPMPDETTATLSAAGSVTFGPIEYALSDAGKTYTYTVTESSFGAGWSGAPASITAEVAVTDNGDGTLGTEVTYDPTNATFTNTYTATGSATLEATKAIDGAAWPSGKTITFTLAGEGGTLPTTKTVSLSEPGKATFGAITYTEADAGKTYTYTISEDGFGKGWTGSGDITATVEVTDNGDGTLSTEVSYSPEDDTITNTYEASGSAVIEVTKALSGAEWPEGKTLTFTLAGEGGTLPETTTVDLTAAGKATFDPITYTAADAGKTYTYTVTESSFGAGWTGSPDEITARVSVTDNGDGTLSTSVTYTPENATFTNTYDATGKINLGATKVLEGEGRTLQPDEFSFTVYDAAGSVVATGTNDAQGNVTFGDINYTLADAGKSFNYTIKENIPEGADEKTHKLGNIIYDPTEYPVTVTVTDNGEGELVAEADKTAAEIVFTNKYVPDPVSATVNINKTLTGVRALKAGEFSFTMVPNGTVAGDPVPAEGLTAAVKADGTAAISAVYTRADTYTYTVTEDIPDDEHKLGGVTYDETEHTVTVTVEDQGGKLVATVSPESVAFTNEYVTKGDAEIDIKKVFEGKNWTDEEEFTIDLYDSTGEKIDSKTLTKDEQTGTFKIEDLTPGTYTYKLKEVVPGSENTSEEQPAEGEQTTEGEQTQDAASENAGAAGTETVPEEAQTETPTEEGTPAATEEVNTDDAAAQAEAPAAEETPAASEEAKAEEEVQTGSIFERLLLVAYAAEGDEETAEKGVVETENGKITYDTNEYNVSIEIIDNENGTCTAAVKYPDGDVVTFNNQYTPNPATVNPEATKTLTGKDLTKGMFQFRLKGNGTNVVVANDADGKVTFPQLSYTKDDAGKTYEYTVSEIKGDLGGVTYDETVYTFTVSVEYDADAGKLTATMSGADGMSFVNTYKPEDVTVNLKAHKTLEGADLTKGEFAFVVESTDGEVVASATNDANGNVTFGGIKFTEEGTYTYKIKEVNTEVENFEYDDSVYTATITVTDDKNGKLVAKVSIDGGSAEFINTYTPPEEPEEPEEPTKGAKTGDDNNIGGWLALMALAAAGGSGLLIMRRREDDE